MLDYLEQFKNKEFDFLTFLEGEQKNSIEIMGTEYQERGEKLNVGLMGDSWHIVLFRENKEDSERYSDMDAFEAVLVEPLEYISGLIPAGFFGIIARKTTTSDKIINNIVDRIKQDMI